MECDRLRKDLPVLLLHNLDQSWSAASMSACRREVRGLRTALRRFGHTVTTAEVTVPALESVLSQYDPSEYVVFNWCEELPGIPHSEARVAEILAEMNFTFTGATGETLRLSWDKRKVKGTLEEAEVPTPRWRVYSKPDPDGWDCFPSIVKPALEHCSYGVTHGAVVLNQREMRQRLEYVLTAFKQPALAEDFIDGREFHVTVWGNGDLEMLPAAEMDFAAFDCVRDRLCTYDSKFTEGSEAYEKIEARVPARLDTGEAELLEATSCRAYRAIGCRDYARMDVRLRDGVFYVLDVNANPDISSETTMTEAARLAGYSRGAMASVLVNLAARRHEVFGAQLDAAIPATEAV